METIPTEIWHEIFSLACTDAGLTGRSLSLVSKDFHDFSKLFKYQSVAITRWGQLVAFSQTFSQLPDFQKKIKYLFIHSPFPFMDVEDDLSLADEQCCTENLLVKGPISPGFVFDIAEDSDSDSDYTESDSESDSEFDGSLDSDEEREVLKDVNYLHSVSKGLQLAPGKIREDEADRLDRDIQAVFDKAIHALHTILNETSLTLKIITLYWTSFKPLPIHHILPPLPVLDELHLFRCSIVEEYVFDKSLTSVLFPRLQLFFMSGDEYHQHVSHTVPTIAPNLTRFRFTTHELGEDGQDCIGDVVVKMSSKWATGQIKALVRGKIDKSELQPVIRFLGELPEAWQCLWSSRVAGRLDAWLSSEEIYYDSDI